MKIRAALGASEGGGATASILVTGATGLLGSYLVQTLEQTNATLTFVGRSGVPPDDRRWANCDLTDHQAVETLFATRQPTLVIHSAALTNVDTCEADPALASDVNSGAAANLARLTDEAGGRFVFISTDSVFNGRSGSYTESDETSPVNNYARSKLEGELSVASAAANHLIIRTNFFGRSKTGIGLADWLLRELGTKRPVVGFQDVVFSPLDVATLAGLILELANSELRGTVHLGASDAVSKFAFAKLLAEAYGLDTQLVEPGLVADARLSAPRPLDTSLISSRATRALGHELPTVAQGVARMRAGDSSP